MTGPINPAYLKAEEQKTKENLSKREKEAEAVKKQVEDAAAAHLALVNKNAKEDEEARKGK